MIPDLPFDDSDSCPRRKGRPLSRTTALVTLDNAIEAVRGHRGDILTILALSGPLSVQQIADRMVVSISVVSHELQKLEGLNLVAWTRCKLQHFYRLTPMVRVLRHTRPGTLRTDRIIITLTVKSGDRLRLTRDTTPWLADHA